MTLGAVKQSAFWWLLGTALTLVVGVGGWETWAALSAAAEGATRFREANDKLAARLRRDVPSDPEIAYWRELYAHYEADFEAIRGKIAQEEAHEDLYFRSGLKEEFVTKGAPIPSGLEVDVVRAAQHWALRGGQHNVPPRAFEENGFSAALTTEINNLVRFGQSAGLFGDAFSVRLPGVEEPAVQGGSYRIVSVGGDTVPSILEAQKSFWGAYTLVRQLAAFNRAAPRAELRVESIDFVAPRAAGTQAPGQPAAVKADAVRETPFYRALPVDLKMTVDFEVLPDLLRAVLSPPAGKTVAPFRFRGGLGVSRLGAAGGERILDMGGRGGRFGSPRGSHPPRESSPPSGSDTRVRVSMELEWIDWEIRPLAEYRPGQ